MSHKEVEKKVCDDCESHYKILFDLHTTCGSPKFCPFCGCETYDNENKFEYDEENE